MKAPKPALDLRQLRALAAVVEEGGHTRAAKALGVSQSTISEALAALERRVGEPLLRREGRRAVPTDAGALVLETARAMLDAESELDRRLAGRVTAPAMVRLGANESVSSYVLPAALVAMRERWPRHEWTVTLGNCAALREKLRSGAIDGALIVEPRDAHAGVDEHAEALQTIELTLFAAPSHPLASRKNVSIEDVQRHPLTLSDAAGTYERLVRAAIDGRGLPPPRVSSMGSVEAVKQWVVDDRAALGLLPRFALERELASGTLAPVALRPPLAPVALRLIAPAALKPPVRELGEVLRAVVSRRG
jgi:DNA-binding transcriptional LysR family regulator